MTPDTIFQLCNGIAMTGWLILIVLPAWHFSDKFIIGIIVMLFAVIYTYYILTNLSAIDMKSFGSLKGVTQLFTNPLAVLIGWVHYLAFDLMVGIWIKKNSLKYGISHWIIIPCLLLTFMFGPIGLLVYLLIRFLRTKNYFAVNYN
ncbi:MAG TPA: ABA4-like family protein [Chitinophagaceae bacterium]|jgi:hypothetical protein|nr:ABA4-like family protein [Chitinophagaceae bacterium]